MTAISLKAGAPLQATPRVSTVSTNTTENKVGTLPVGESGKIQPTSQVGKVQQATKVVPTPEELQRITEELQHHIATLAPELQFSVDESSGQSIMKFTDRTTNEVIRQFPSLEALEVTKALDRFQRGLLLNRKV